MLQQTGQYKASGGQCVSMQSYFTVWAYSFQRRSCPFFAFLLYISTALPNLFPTHSLSGIKALSYACASDAPLCWEEIMVDSVTPALRSEIMSRVRSKDTGPEMVVRRMLHKAGYRYRLHVANLPGKPDLVFVGLKKVIFIHGCFWHMHESCAGSRIPKSRVEFWTAKLSANRERDAKNVSELRQLGWDVLTIWECELAGSDLLKKMRLFLA